MPQDTAAKVVIIGGGFTGLSAAWELVNRGVSVTVLESDMIVGGLAGGYEVGGEILEKFYHHWFRSDVAILDLIKEMELEDRVVEHESRTGLYFANTLYRLSKPLDVLRFKPLSFVGRIRLGLLAIRARMVKDWRALESVTAKDWLISLGGREVYKIVWEPLLKGKFGSVAEDISAVWFWNKLCLRGGSRNKAGNESLVYFRTGFMGLAQELAKAIEQRGGKVLTGVTVNGIDATDGKVAAVRTDKGSFSATHVVATPALPLIADMLGSNVPPAYAQKLRAITYFANVCLVLQLDRSLSDTYWINVNDGDFPFVGIIEHTNFESPSTYGGRHIVYLSKYLPIDHQLYNLTPEELLEYSLPFIQRMFPKFERTWILDYNVWRAEFAQPLVGLHYSKLIPDVRTPIDGFYIASMAQIYPEDRGTNYAVREGRKIGALVARDILPA